MRPSNRARLQIRGLRAPRRGRMPASRQAKCKIPIRANKQAKFETRTIKATTWDKRVHSLRRWSRINPPSLKSYGATCPPSLGSFSRREAMADKTAWRADSGWRPVENCGYCPWFFSRLMESFDKTAGGDSPRHWRADFVSFFLDFQREMCELAAFPSQNRIRQGV